jgi:hypothetical protein
MNLKVTVEINGTPYTKEQLIDEQPSMAHIFILDILQDVLLDADLMDEGNRLEVIDSDQAKILDQAGY